MNREIDIQNYWIEIVKNKKQFQEIAKAENPEFNNLTVLIEKLLLDAFIQDSTEYGVERREKILKIIPAENESLDDRKIRILTYLNVKIPYTWKVLEQTLISIVGSDNLEMNYNNRLYTIDITIKVSSLNQFHDIKNMINKVIPQNIIVNLKGEEIK